LIAVIDKVLGHILCTYADSQGLDYKYEM
jgi:hypothetical protein